MVLTVGSDVGLSEEGGVYSWGLYLGHLSCID